MLIVALAAVAWEHRSVFHRSLRTGTTGPAVTHEALEPIPINGTGGPPRGWVAEPSNGVRELTPVPGGVDMRLVLSDYDQWQSVPIWTPGPWLVVHGDVQFVAGGSDNAIGLGCADQTTERQIGFHVHDDRTWTLVYSPPGDGTSQDVDSGYSSAIRPTTGANLLTVSCVSPSTPGAGTHVMASVNGVTVVNDLVAVPSTALFPTIDQCSCYGVDTGQFTDLTVNPS